MTSSRDTSRADSPAATIFVLEDEPDIALGLEGDLTAEQRARLLEIAGKCPTARLLAQPLVLACRLTD